MVSLGDAKKCLVNTLAVRAMEKGETLRQLEEKIANNPDGPMFEEIKKSVECMEEIERLNNLAKEIKEIE